MLEYLKNKKCTTFNTRNVCLPSIFILIYIFPLPVIVIHITWVSMHAISYFVCNFLCNTFHWSVWHFQFSEQFVYLAGSRHVRWAQKICMHPYMQSIYVAWYFSLFFSSLSHIKLNKDAIPKCAHRCCSFSKTECIIQNLSRAYAACETKWIISSICAG